MVPVARVGQARIDSASGFTLIEMLVVMLIIGLMAKTLMTTLALTSNNSLQREAESLAWLLRENALQARASGQAVTWRAIPSGYEFTLEPGNAAPANSSQEKAEPKTHLFAEGIKVLSIRTAEDEQATQLLLSGRRIAGASTITLANHEEAIEVVSEGLDRFTVSSAHTRAAHATR